MQRIYYFRSSNIYKKAGRRRNVKLKGLLLLAMNNEFKLVLVWKNK